ncbi:MAG: gamma-glutamyl-gamma-aminobutyrate hydrolase family protein [Phycisphaerae bacterium]
MPRRPVIGISLDNQAPEQSHRVYELPATYALAIEKAGGVPILLHHTHDPVLQAAYIDVIDGLLIPGGADLDPAIYGQNQHPKTRRLDSLRQAFDLAMLALAKQRNLPVLGICFGCQAMNVQRGGSLHQYIPDVLRPIALAHAANTSNTADKNAWHTVSIAPRSRLHAILNCDEVTVNSRHRQAIDRLGAGLAASALSPDGLVEAIEDDNLKFWLGVQWHPEGLATSPHPELFRAFVAAA